MKTIAMFAAATALSVTNADEYFTGDGTAYTLGQTSAGNCNMMSALDFATTDYAALNDKQWDGLQNCGRCAEVSCADDRCSDQTTSVVVQILDRCPECQHGDLDLSPSVFTKLTGSTPSRYTVKWKFVDCPVQGNVNYCLKGGSNNFWTAVQPTNFATGVQNLQINGQETTMLGSAYYYLLDGASEAQTDLSSVTITMTDVNGNAIEDTVSLTADSCTEGANQFPSGGTTSQTSQQTYQQSTPTTTTPTTTSPAPTTATPTTSPQTQAPKQTPAPTQTPTQAPTQTPSPTTVRPASPATTAPSPEQQEILPTTVPVSTTVTPTTAPPSTTSPPTIPPSTTAPSTIPPSTTAPSTTAPVTTAPVTTAPVTIAPESSTTQEAASSSGSDVNQFDQQTFNVTGTVEPESTPSPKTTSKTTVSSTTDDTDEEDESTQQTQQTQEKPAATTAAPTSNTEQTADSKAAGDDTQTVNTQSGETSNGTDPLIIVLSTLGAVGMVALIVAVVMAKRKSIQQEKARDMEAPSMTSMQSFDVNNTPAERRQAFGIL